MMEYGIHNIWLYNFYTPIEITLLLLLAYDGLKIRWERASILCWLAVVWCIFFMRIAERLRAEEFVSATFMAGAFGITVAFVYLLFQLAQNSDEALVHQPRFWLYLGVVLYFGGLIPLYGLLNKMISINIPDTDRLYDINDVLCLTRYGMVIGACVLAMRKQVTS